MERNVFESFNIAESTELSESEISDSDQEWQPPDRPVSASDLDQSSDTDQENDTDNVDPTQTSFETPSVSSTQTIMGKNKDTAWHLSPFSEARTPPKNMVRIPKNRTPYTDHIRHPSEAFLLFINGSMIKTVVECTNKEGLRVLNDKWKLTDETEMVALLGCLLHTGCLHQNSVALDTLFSPVDGNPLLRAAFSKDRFSNLLDHIRFDDKETRSARCDRDKFAPIRDIWDHFHANLAKYYHPGENITVDEQLVPFRGRCSFIQYMPSKPDKYGIKIFWACDAVTNYPLRGKPYLGKESSGQRSTDVEKNSGVGFNTVMTLTSDFRGSGRNITCDNFFTDLELAESLARANLTVVGTVRRNKRFLPEPFQRKKHLPLGHSEFVFRKDTTLVSFQSKKQKNVLLLSTMHSQPEVDETTSKPCIVKHYNKTKGGVDAMDQMAHAFTVKRKTKRWPLVVFYNCLDLASIASRVVWRSKFPVDKMSHEDNRQLFNMGIARHLCLKQIQRRQHIPTLQASVRHNLETVLHNLEPEPSTSHQRKRPRIDKEDKDAGKQKRCQLCPAKKDRKTKARCEKCRQFICKDHTVLQCSNCFF